jgi:hypothetical protein
MGLRNQQALTKSGTYVLYLMFDAAIFDGLLR